MAKVRLLMCVLCLQTELFTILTMKEVDAVFTKKKPLNNLEENIQFFNML